MPTQPSLPVSSTSAAAAHAIKALQEKNYRLECDMQVMDDLVDQYKNEVSELKEERKKEGLDGDQGWPRERDDLLEELKVLRQTVARTRSEAEKDAKER